MPEGQLISIDANHILAVITIAAAVCHNNPADMMCLLVSTIAELDEQIKALGLRASDRPLHEIISEMIQGHMKMTPAEAAAFEKPAEGTA